MKKKLIIFILVIALIIIGIFGYYGYNKKITQEKLRKKQEIKQQLERIKSHYNSNIKLTKDCNLYYKNKKIAILAKEEIVSLSDVKINAKLKYFPLAKADYTIDYDCGVKADNSYTPSDRYKKYILFNENIVTKENTWFYRDNKMVYQALSSLDLPIIKKNSDGYYVEVFDELLFVKKEDVVKTYEKENSNETIAKQIAVVLYHFFYDPSKQSCGQTICHPLKQVEEQFKYLNDNHFFTIDTQEISDFIDGNIKLPKKSVLLTIDDGWSVDGVLPLLEEYKVNATIFLITGWYAKESFPSKYLEYASHTNLMHITGVCPNQLQGGAITCSKKETILADLKESREKLDNTKAISYPFFEYNDYAISLVKEAGFDIAFVGGGRKVTPNINKYKVPRITIFRSTTLGEFINYIN